MNLTHTNMGTRKAVILERLEQAQEINVRELAELFGVTEMTVRRDFNELQEQGLLERTHGGAVSSARLKFLHIGRQGVEHSRIKAAIGKCAASLVKPGQTIVIDTGTTAIQVARHLPQDQSITVATTSLHIAQDLYGTDVNVLILGGFLRKDFPSVYGPITEKLLNDLHVDILFAGCDGAHSSEGFYSNDLHVSSLEQVMIRIADKVVVVTESSKFKHKAFSRYANVEQVHTLVTDTGISSDDRTNLENAGVCVLTALL